MTIRDASSATLDDAARYLAQGGLVAFPTETVYGLGADATNTFAVAGLFAAKGRPTFNPLIIHVPSVELAWHIGVPTEAARSLATAFWPGPLTLVMQRQVSSDVVDLATAGLDTVAVRVPAHPVALQIISRSARPIAAPSANRSGRVSPTMAEHVAADFGNDLPIIVDGGPTAIGLESTIVDVSGPHPVLLRPGGLTRGALERVLGRSVIAPKQQNALTPSAPGQLESHYAPNAKVRLDATIARDDEALLAFGPPIDHTGPCENLSLTADPIEAAAHLFAMLRRLDASGAHTIAVMPVPNSGLGEAINDRLRRAAAPR